MTKQEIIDYLEANDFREYAPQRFSNKSKIFVEVHQKFTIITKGELTKLRLHSEVKQLDFQK